MGIVGCCCCRCYGNCRIGNRGHQNYVFPFFLMKKRMRMTAYLNVLDCSCFFPRRTVLFQLLPSTGSASTVLIPAKKVYFPLSLGFPRLSGYWEESILANHYWCYLYLFYCHGDFFVNVCLHCPFGCPHCLCWRHHCCLRMVLENKQSFFED